MTKYNVFVYTGNTYFNRVFKSEWAMNQFIDQMRRAGADDIRVITR